MRLKLSIAIIISLFFLYGSYATKFIIKNKCSHTIWPATQAGQGAQIHTGFELASNASITLRVPKSWSGRVWARYRCAKYGKYFTCLSGDCGTGQIRCNGSGGIPPISLVQFTIAGWSGGKDFYSVSVVDGFNLPLNVYPLNRPDCGSTVCEQNLNDMHCNEAEELEVKDPDGYVIGCKSGCLAFHRDDLCCTGAYATPETCKPNEYSLKFRQMCTRAYTYPFDKNSVFTCINADYLITFCPWEQG